MSKSLKAGLLNLLTAYLTDSQSSSSGPLVCSSLCALSTFSPSWSLLDAGHLANPSPDALLSPSISLTLGTP